MNEPSQNELLSAYLDGELSADERVRVEQWLDEDAAARQRLDELRAVAASMKALPAYRLDEDLSAWVLRAAEHRILAEPTSLADGVPAATPAEEPTARRLARRFLSPRAILWSGVAVAVAILLMVVPFETPRGGRELARKSEKRAAAESVPAFVAGPEEKAETPSGAVGEPYSYASQPASSTDKSASLKHSMSKQAFGQPAAEAGKASAGKFAAKAQPQNHKLGRVATKAVAPSEATVPGAAGSDLPATAPQRMFRKGPPTYGAVTAQTAVGRAAQNRAGLLVVNCSLTPEALSNRAFTRTLLSNSIDVVEVPAEEEHLAADVVTSNVAQRAPASAEQSARFRANRDRLQRRLGETASQRVAGPSPPVEADLAKMPQQTLGSADREQRGVLSDALSTVPESPEAEVVLVEGSPSQIGSTIEALARRKDVCVMIDPQQAAAQWFRGREIASGTADARGEQSGKKADAALAGWGLAPGQPAGQPRDEDTAQKTLSPAQNLPVPQSLGQQTTEFAAAQPRGTAQRLGTIALDETLAAGQTPATMPEATGLQPAKSTGGGIGGMGFGAMGGAAPQSPAVQRKASKQESAHGNRREPKDASRSSSIATQTEGDGQVPRLEDQLRQLQTTLEAANRQGQQPRLQVLFVLQRIPDGPPVAAAETPAADSPPAAAASKIDAQTEPNPEPAETPD